MADVESESIRSGSCVSFRLGDAICPGFGQVVSQIGPEVRICGEVAFFSDRGRDKGHFAIIAVDGLATPLIVPVSKLNVFIAEGSIGAIELPDRDADRRVRRLQPPGERREAG